MRLAVGTSGAVRDLAGWPLATGQVSAGGYQMSHLRFTAIPESLITVDSGESCGMSVAVSGGTGTRTYQWFFDDAVKANAALPGETGPALDIPKTRMEDDGVYYCEVTDAHETIQSPPTRLQVRSVLPLSGAAGLFLTAVVLALAGARRAAGRRLYLFRHTPL